MAFIPLYGYPFPTSAYPLNWGIGQLNSKTWNHCISGYRVKRVSITATRELKVSM
nr:Hypothetical protein [Aeromonas caviae]